MKTTIQELQILREDLNLLLGETFDARITKIINLVKVIKPEVKKKIVKAGRKLKCEITEAGRTTELFFENDTQADKFLILKQKERAKRINLFCKAEGIYAPSYSYGDDVKYHKDCLKYSEILKNAGLDFTVKITTL